MNKAGNSFTNDRIKFLEKVIAKIGKSKIKGLFADREFIGSTWFDDLIKNKILFYIRMKGDRLAKGIREGYDVPLKDVFRYVKEGRKKI